MGWMLELQDTIFPGQCAIRLRRGFRCISADIFNPADWSTFFGLPYRVHLALRVDPHLESVDFRGLQAAVGANERTWRNPDYSRGDCGYDPPSILKLSPVPPPDPTERCHRWQPALVERFCRVTLPFAHVHFQPLHRHHRGKTGHTTD